MEKIVIGKKPDGQDLYSLRDELVNGLSSMVNVKDDSRKTVTGRILAQVEGNKIKVGIDRVTGFDDISIFLEINGDNISLEYDKADEKSTELARQLIKKLGFAELKVDAPSISIPGSTAPSTPASDMSMDSSGAPSTLASDMSMDSSGSPSTLASDMSMDSSGSPTPHTESLEISSSRERASPGVEEELILSGSSGERLSADLDGRGERLSAELDSRGERLSADLDQDTGPNRLDLGNRSYKNKGFSYMRTLAMASDELTDDLNEVRISAFTDITPTGWEKAKSAFIDTMTKLKSGELVGMHNFLYKDEQRDYQVSYEKEGRAFYAAMEIPKKEAGNEMLLKGVDPKTGQQYVTKFAYDPVERKVDHVFPKPQDVESEKFSPNELQLLASFEMLRETAKYSQDKSFTISGTKNTDLIVKCIQMGNSLGLKPKMSDSVKKHMLREIAEHMDKFNETFSGTTPEEILSSIEGSTYKGITPDGSPEKRLAAKRSP